MIKKKENKTVLIKPIIEFSLIKRYEKLSSLIELKKKNSYKKINSFNRVFKQFILINT